MNGIILQHLLFGPIVPRGKTQQKVTPFSLAYGVDEVVHVVIMIPSALGSKLTNPMIEYITWRSSRKKREEKVRWLYYQKKQSLQSKGETSTICVRNVVLKMVRHVQNGLNASKLNPNWEVLDITKEAFDSVISQLPKPESEELLSPTNAKRMKLHLSLKKKKGENLFAFLVEYSHS